MKKNIWSILGLLGLIVFSGCTDAMVGEISKPTHRPTMWAVPVQESGVPNLFRVNKKLYRSAQPKPGDYEKLYMMGICNILNLRKFHSDQAMIGKIPIKEYRVPIFILALDYNHLVEAVRYIVRSESPVLVHCMYGSDRTGTVVAAYRIAMQGWSKEKAIIEMTKGGYGYHTILSGYLEIIRTLDVDQFRQDIYQKSGSRLEII